MYYGINDSHEFAEKCGMVLLDERTFLPNALSLLLKKIVAINKNIYEYSGAEKAGADPASEAVLKRRR